MLFDDVVATSTWYIWRFCNNNVCGDGKMRKDTFFILLESFRFFGLAIHFLSILLNGLIGCTTHYTICNVSFFSSSSLLESRFNIWLLLKNNTISPHIFKTHVVHIIQHFIHADHVNDHISGHVSNHVIDIPNKSKYLYTHNTFNHAYICRYRLLVSFT